MKSTLPHTLSWYQLPQMMLFTVILLYIGKSFFVPIGLGILLSFILFPITKWFEQRKYPRSLAIAASFLIIGGILLALLGIVGYQLQTMAAKVPILVDKSSNLFAKLQKELAEHWHISLEQQMAWLRSSLQEATKYFGQSLSNTLALTIDFFIFIIFVPFISTLLLLHREKFITFLFHIFPEKYHTEIVPILHESINTFYNYIKGLLVVYVVVAVLNSLGLLLLGINNAIFYGILTAILTVIPYFGIMLGAILPITEAWLMHDNIWYPLGVVAVFSVVQYIEANVVFPIAVGHQLRINTFATLMALLLGGIIWGAVGMVLFLPFTAIFKLIADKTASLKFIGDVLGED